MVYKMTKLYVVRSSNPESTGVTTNWYDEATQQEIDEAAGMTELRQELSKVTQHDSYATKRMIDAEDKLDAITFDEMMTYYSGLSDATRRYEDGVEKLREQRDALLEACKAEHQLLGMIYIDGTIPEWMKDVVIEKLIHKYQVEEAAIVLCDKAAKELQAREQAATAEHVERAESYPDPDAPEAPNAST